MGPRVVSHLVLYPAWLVARVQVEYRAQGELTLAGSFALSLSFSGIIGGSPV